MTERQIAELHESKDDPDEWDDEKAPVAVRPSATEVVSFRVPSDELDRIQQAAKDRHESISDFIRDSIRMRLQGQPQSVLDDITTGAQALVLVAGAWGLGSRVSKSWVPDFPPQTQNLTSSEGAPTPSTGEPRLPLEV